MSISDSAIIHPSAIVAEGAIIGDCVRIGPYCVIGSDVTIGAGTELKSHVSIDGHTVMGEGNIVFPFASLGQRPQDLKYKGERTLLQIGNGNTIREYVTMNPGTVGGGGETRVGDGNLFMNHVHLGHDCIIGSHAIFANAATLGGHVVVGDGAVIGGLAGIHQFVRIGAGAMIGGLAGVVADVIPYGTVTGERAHLAGLNLVGLKRRGAEKAHINGLRAAYGALFEGDGTLTERAARVAESHADNPLVAEVLEFLAEGSSRHVTTPE
ncbi:acyl-ACP--UDP-N-acetylglucosamine O-acyltransferase [Halovulum dunhuangense]|uniref:Acyl-[acyl-carrier-protein]--UDP-N-acetylglucosamine O-acyltransferase n=1 Tax=Halovulum dunhuangense TaxID=1505036 RepID=A0A849L303_9RHOB|nr:acyl-ACP--UDP-N-acetylglucosamine O-acyltransferase [Halovulum dunhuangense]NNU80706.1 acyl-ACP--UDP-N-acetylglucosamine O-acyltransferase [Halovulum dunhuangense]